MVLGLRPRRVRVVMHVGFAGVVLVLFVLAVVVAVGGGVVVVFVAVPRCLMLPLTRGNPTAVMMGDVPVVVRMGDGGMGVCARLALAFDLLLSGGLSACCLPACWLHVIAFLPCRDLASAPKVVWSVSLPSASAHHVRASRSARYSRKQAPFLVARSRDMSKSTCRTAFCQPTMASLRRRDMGTT